MEKEEKTMRIAYFDCFSGASGDMILGSLIDAGLSLRRLREELKKIRISTIHLKAKKVLKAGISGTQVVVEGRNEKRSHRNLKEIRRIIEGSGVDAEVKEKSNEIFNRIASVEAKIHQTPIEEVHFHELGGLDSIVDIVGAVWGIQELGIEKVYVSKVNVGGGFVKCEHGILPVPAPATLSLMEGKPIYSSGVERELFTPTGAAVLTTLGSEFGSMPLINVERIGHGAGRDDLVHPNLLTVICPSEKLPSITEFLLRETTTLGLRWHEEERAKTDREILPLQTRYGRIRFKLARWEGTVINLSPEYEDCKRLALEKGVPLKEIFEEARKESMTFRKGKPR